MDIDISSIIIGIIALSFFFVPVIYFEYFKKRSAKKFTALFKDEAQKNGIDLSQFDVWRDRYGIGINSNANKLFYLNQKSGQNETRTVDLDAIKKCIIAKDDERIKTAKGNLRLTTRVDLLFEHIKSTQPDTTLEIFKGENGDSVRDEVQLAEKWSKRVNSLLTKK